MTLKPKGQAAIEILLVLFLAISTLTLLLQSQVWRSRAISQQHSGERASILAEALAGAYVSWPPNGFGLGAAQWDASSRRPKPNTLEQIPSTVLPEPFFVRQIALRDAQNSEILFEKNTAAPQCAIGSRLVYQDQHVQKLEVSVCEP